MSDAPKTDKMWHDILSAPDDYAEWSNVKKLWQLATQLERENAALREALEISDDYLNQMLHGDMEITHGQLESWRTVIYAARKEAQP